MQGLCPPIQVYDMPTSLRFYRDLLGFEIYSSSAPSTPDNSGWVWLKRNGAELMLNTAYDADSRPAAPRSRRSQSPLHFSSSYGPRKDESRSSARPAETGWLNRGRPLEWNKANAVPTITPTSLHALARCR